MAVPNLQMGKFLGGDWFGQFITTSAEVTPNGPNTGYQMHSKGIPLKMALNQVKDL